MVKAPFVGEIENYNTYFSESEFLELVRRSAKTIGKKTLRPAFILYYMYRDGLDLIDRLVVLGALGYLILPADLLPDAIPFFGFTDDASVISLVYNKFKGKATSAVIEKADTQLNKWFN